MPTWATSQQMVRVQPQGRGGPPPPAAASPATPPPPAPAPPTAPAAAPTAAPATAPLPPLQTFNNQTVRMILRTSIGGRRARVKLSNAFNGTPVEIGAAHIAIRDKDSGIVAASDRALTFSGRPSIKMTPGMVVVSDPVDLTIAPLTDLAVSLYFPGDTGAPTTHATGLRPTYISREGNFAAQPDHPRRDHADVVLLARGASKSTAPAGTPLIVAFGDSITDGARSTPDTHNTLAGNSGDAPGRRQSDGALGDRQSRHRRQPRADATAPASPASARSRASIATSSASPACSG